MKVKVAWKVLNKILLENSVYGENEEFDPNRLIELEATPVEEGFVCSVTGCNITNQHYHTSETSYTSSLVNTEQPKELKRLYDFNACTNAPYILLTESLNKELDQIYTAINELRKDTKVGLIDQNVFKDDYYKKLVGC